MSNCLPAKAVERAQALIGAVHDEEPAEVASMLALPLGDLYALAVTLAAMVPIDHAPAELLAWNDTVRALRPKAPTPGGLMPHGTHAAFNRHRTNGTDPCDSCWDGERDYQRARARRDRTKRREVVSA